MAFRIKGRAGLASLISIAAITYGGIGLTLAWYESNVIGEVDFNSVSLSTIGNLHLGYEDNGSIRYDVEGSLNYQSEARVMRNVSGMFSSSWLNSKDSLPLFYVPYSESTSTTITEEAVDGFIQQTVYFKADAAAHLFLGQGSYVNLSQAPSPGQKSPIDALRISFYCQDSYFVSEPGQISVSQTRFGGPLQIVDKDGYYDYADGKEIIYGEYTGTPTYLPALEEDLSLYDISDSFHAKHKAGIERVNIDSINIAIEETYTFGELILPDNHNAEGTPYLGILLPNQDVRLVISIYIEGWDLDSVDEICGIPFDVNLSFVALADIVEE